MTAVTVGSTQFKGNNWSSKKCMKVFTQSERYTFPTLTKFKFPWQVLDKPQIKIPRICFRRR